MGSTLSAERRLPKKRAKESFKQDSLEAQAQQVAPIRCQHASEKNQGLALLIAYTRLRKSVMAWWCPAPAH